MGCCTAYDWCCCCPAGSSRASSAGTSRASSAGTDQAPSVSSIQKVLHQMRAEHVSAQNQRRVWRQPVQVVDVQPGADPLRVHVLPPRRPPDPRPRLLGHTHEERKIIPSTPTTTRTIYGKQYLKFANSIYRI